MLTMPAHFELLPEPRQRQLRSAGHVSSKSRGKKLYPIKALTPKQQILYDEPGRVKGFVAGRGCGNTEFGAYFVQTMAKAGEHWLCISPDYNVLMDTTWVSFEKVARELGKWVDSKKTPQPQVWFRTEDGGIAHLIFKSAEKPEKLRGPNKSGIWFDEASIMVKDAFLLAVMVLRENGIMGPELYTFTPRGRKHWTFGRFFEPCNEEELEILNSDEPELIGNLDQYQEVCGQWYRLKKSTALVQAHSRENPFLPPEYEELGSHYTSAMREQELGGLFIELEGLLFRREWFKLISREQVPFNALRVRYWDRAGTEDGGCYSVGLLMARDEDGIYYVEDVQRGQWSPERRNAVILETARRDAKRYGNEVLIYAEQEGGSAGKEISQQFLKMLTGFPVYIDIVSGQRYRTKDAVRVPGDAKLTRAMPLAAQSDPGPGRTHGNVRVVRAPWTDDYLDELAVFGESDLMDQVDGSSGAFNCLNRRWSGTPSRSSRLPNKSDSERHGVQVDRHGR